MQKKRAHAQAAGRAGGQMDRRAARPKPSQAVRSRWPQRELRVGAARPPHSVRSSRTASRAGIWLAPPRGASRQLMPAGGKLQD